MLLTPTYHVFHMYKHHQGAELVESYLEEREANDATVQESVSVDRDGVVTVTLTNPSLHDAQDMEILFEERKPVDVKGYIVQGAMNAYNTFDEPKNVVEEEFTAFAVKDRGLSFVIPPRSVMMFRIR